MSEPVGKAHADKTQKRWSQGLRDPDPSGSFVAYVCDLLQDYSAGRRKLDGKAQTAVAKRAARLKLKPLDVWNAIVCLAHALPRDIK